MKNGIRKTGRNLMAGLALLAGVAHVRGGDAIMRSYSEDRWFTGGGPYRVYVSADNTSSSSFTSGIDVRATAPSFFNPLNYGWAPLGRDFFEGESTMETLRPIEEVSGKSIWPGGKQKVGDVIFYDFTVDSGAPVGLTKLSLDDGNILFSDYFGNPQPFTTQDDTIMIYSPNVPADLHPIGNPDGDVDADDRAVFESCASGPAVPHNGNSECYKADLDDDGDVDQSDFGLFQRCLSGENMPANPNCAN